MGSSFLSSIYINRASKQPHHDTADNILKIHIFFRLNDYRKMQLERQAPMIKKKAAFQ